MPSDAVGDQTTEYHASFAILPLEVCSAQVMPSELVKTSGVVSTTTTKRFCSGLHATLRGSTPAGIVRIVQVAPSGLVINAPLRLTATKSPVPPTPGAHVEEYQAEVVVPTAVWLVQVRPSVDVIICAPSVAELFEAAKNFPRPGLHAIVCHALSVEYVSPEALQLVPLLEYMTRVPVPVVATATNLLFAELHATENQLLFAAPVPAVHVPVPVALHIVPELFFATATNTPSSGLHATEFHWLAAED